MSYLPLHPIHGHSYEGWTVAVEPYDDGEGFSSYIFAAEHSDGTRKPLSWSRFQDYSFRHFEMFVDLGLPGSIANASGQLSNWYPAEIEAAHARLTDTRLAA